MPSNTPQVATGYHPHANLPEDRSLVAYSDGIWIVEGGCMLAEFVRYARVCDSWPVYLNHGGIGIFLNERGEIPLPGAGRHNPLVLLTDQYDIAIAQVPALAGGWDHAGLAVALLAQREAIASAPVVRAMLGPEQLGSTQIRGTPNP